MHAPDNAGATSVQDESQLENDAENGHDDELMVGDGNQERWRTDARGYKLDRRGKRNI